MSREERRAYQRMTKKQDPYAPPTSGAAGARLRRQERIKARRGATPATPQGAISRRFLYWTIGGAAGIGLIAFSVAWPQMPFAAYVGGGAAAAWIVLAIVARAMVGRAPRR